MLPEAELPEGSRTDYMSTPPIAFAVMGGDFELVKRRVEAGGDINQVTDKGTALHVACIYQREEIGRYLLEHGADPRAKDRYGQMPIDVADDEKMVALLREYGVHEFGIHESNTLERDGQSNALILGNRNDSKLLTELTDPLDNYHGVYVPWLTLTHLQSLEEAFDIEPISADAAIVAQGDTGPRLFLLDKSLMKRVDVADDELFEKAQAISRLRPFQKTRFWDKYNVFLLLCDLRALRPREIEKVV